MKINIRPARPKPKFCEVCARRWMKELWAGSCVCTGDVDLRFTMPGKIERMDLVKPVTPQLTNEQKEKLMLDEQKKKVKAMNSIAFKPKGRRK